jgi:hypothetical protein
MPIKMYTNDVSAHHFKIRANPKICPPPRVTENCLNPTYYFSPLHTATHPTYPPIALPITLPIKGLVSQHS